MPRWVNSFIFANKRNHATKQKHFEFLPYQPLPPLSDLLYYILNSRAKRLFYLKPYTKIGFKNAIKFVKYIYLIFNELPEFEMRVKLEKKKTDDFIHIQLLDIGSQSHDLNTISISLSRALYHVITKQPILGTHMLPTERNAIHTFGKDLSVASNDLLEHTQSFLKSFERLQKRATRYPMAIRDGLGLLDDLENFCKTRGEFARFADQIEHDILDGTITIDGRGTVLFAPTRPKVSNCPFTFQHRLQKLCLVLFFT